MACLTPPLNKVPRGDYVCPHCNRDGVTVQDVAEERKRQRALQETNPAPLQPTAPLFRDAAARRRKHEQSVFDSRIVAVKERKGEDKKLAVLTYLGANAGLKSYRAKFGDGSSTLLSPTEVKRGLMPEGTTLS